MMEKTFNINKEQFIGISNFLNIAYKDYLASRILLNAGQLYRGVIIANTAIEKYLKVFIYMLGEKKKTHDVSKLLDITERFDKDLKATINNDFINFVCKAYLMRYLDTDIFSKPDKNFYLCVSQYKALAELDYTVYVLQNSINISKDGFKLESMYHDDISNKNPYLYDNNYVLQEINKTQFIERKQQVYEINSIKREGIFEIYRNTVNVKNDGIFVLEKSYFADFDSIYQKNSTTTT